MYGDNLEVVVGKLKSLSKLRRLSSKKDKIEGTSSSGPTMWKGGGYFLSLSLGSLEGSGRF